MVADDNSRQILFITGKKGKEGEGVGKKNEQIQRRSYEEICKDLSTATPGKEARKLHKELKAYGDRLSLWQRYPVLVMCIPLVFSGVLTVIATLLIIKRI